MAKKKRLLELQMDELKTEIEEIEHVEEKPITSTPQPPKNSRNNDAEIAALYEDAAEYELELEWFEKELATLQSNHLTQLVDSLNAIHPEYEGDYEKEVKSVLENGWQLLVQKNSNYCDEYLEVLKGLSVSEAVQKLSQMQSDIDFEADFKSILQERWNNIIAIKKEHIKEEIAEIKTRGLKPDYVKKIYKRFHGIS